MPPRDGRVLSEDTTERSIVSKLHQDLIDPKNKSLWLKKASKFVNLANKGFREIYKDWWGSETPPDLEVDLVLVFEDMNKLVDDALIVGVEVEYIEDRTKNFYIGLDQVLSFALFGFDGFALWHVFSPKASGLVNSYRRALRETARLHRLSIHYVTLQETPEVPLKYCEDYITPYEISASRLAEMTRLYFTGENSYRRLPLHKLNLPRTLVRRPEDQMEADMFRATEACKKRRGTLKTMLRIPV